MGEFIDASVVFVLGWGSVALIALIIYKFVKHIFCWTKDIRF